MWYHKIIHCLGLISVSEIGINFHQNRPVSIHLNGIGVISSILPKLEPILQIKQAVFGLNGIATQVLQLSLNHARLADNDLLLEIKIHDILDMIYGLAGGGKSKFKTTSEEGAYEGTADGAIRVRIDFRS